ncbi:uncharacterized protein LOC134282283 [Saccostrea cucullata]|uniref:uncharacterized protein LOC134236237 n=1 Tax=Saccostrea cuccullata TaxID=36930 RepID=UPI002ED269C5
MPSGPTPGYRVSLPVIIGTIPLHSSVKQYQTNYGVTATELTTLPQSGSGATPMSLPSPRYSEYVFGKTSIREKEDSKHTMGELDYAPMYTYYNMSNKPVADQGK